MIEFSKNTRLRFKGQTMHYRITSVHTEFHRCGKVSVSLTLVSWDGLSEVTITHAGLPSTFDDTFPLELA